MRRIYRCSEICYTCAALRCKRSITKHLVKENLAITKVGCFTFLYFRQQKTIPVNDPETNLVSITSFVPNDRYRIAIRLVIGGINTTAFKRNEFLYSIFDNSQAATSPAVAIRIIHNNRKLTTTAKTGCEFLLDP